jgi:hypothetical protein
MAEKLPGRGPFTRGSLSSRNVSGAVSSGIFPLAENLDAGEEPALDCFRSSLKIGFDFTAYRFTLSQFMAVKISPHSGVWL